MVLNFEPMFLLNQLQVLLYKSQQLLTTDVILKETHNRLEAFIFLIIENDS